MNFNSLTYLLFLPAVWIAYHLLPKRRGWIVLLAASYFFYMSWNAAMGLLMAATTAVAYLAARAMPGLASSAVKKLLLGLTVAVCLGALVVFKYLNFIIGGVCELIGLFAERPTFDVMDIILPVGISFYTFQTLSYVIDVYRGRIAPEKHFGYFALFVSFFPQLVAGPIERPENLLPQLKAARTPDAGDVEAGMRLLLSGFFRKVVVADFAGIIVDEVYAAPAAASAPAVILATLLFAVQIYCDFSGYSEIAAGSARLFGIRLMKNFDRPYGAVGLRDFWRRWHISLGRWFSDYLYIPLGGKRKGIARQCLNLLIVFVISGLWHGAALTFLLWGAYHGVCLVIETLFCKACGSKIAPTGAARLALQTLTFTLVCFGWIFFRADSLDSAFVLIGKLFTAWDFSSLTAIAANADMGMAELAALCVSIAALVPLRYLTKDLPCLTRPLLLTEGEVLKKLDRRTVLYLALGFVIAAAWMTALARNETSAFIYFRF